MPATEQERRKELQRNREEAYALHAIESADRPEYRKRVINRLKKYVYSELGLQILSQLDQHVEQNIQDAKHCLNKQYAGH